jgi:hypothetical protein
MFSFILAWVKKEKGLQTSRAKIFSPWGHQFFVYLKKVSAFL